MKIYFPCRKCDSPDSLTEYIVNDTGFYIGICKNRHESKVYAQDQLFEVLFEIGVAAIKDGYYREAISSFATSLERLYEFYIRSVFSSKQFHDLDFSNLWKKVSNQSERQLGAFIFLYSIENGSLPNLLSKDDTEFRNKVIHKGIIPNAEQCLNFGQNVLDIIYDIIDNLKANFPDQITKMTDQHLEDLAKKYGQLSDGIAWTMTASLINDGRITVRDALGNLDLIGH